DTLGLTLAAVALSLLIGIPLGILAGRNDAFQRFVNPILDVMQISPGFAYLGIITLLLRIGGASAAIATLIYAMPAAIRITSLAIRGVPPATVRAAGPPAAPVARMISGMPPAVRIPSPAIRGVPPATVEAAGSLGATRWQTLGKVQPPAPRGAPPPRAHPHSH